MPYAPAPTVADFEKLEPLICDGEPVFTRLAPGVSGKPVRADQVAFRTALYKIVLHRLGTEGLYRQFEILTGLSNVAIRALVFRANVEPNQETEADRELDPDEIRYLRRQYDRTKDPTVRDFLQTVGGAGRRGRTSPRSSSRAGRRSSGSDPPGESAAARPRFAPRPPGRTSPRPRRPASAGGPHPGGQGAILGRD